MNKKEKVSINSFSLFTCKIVISKDLSETLIEKSSSLYWYKRRQVYKIRVYLHDPDYECECEEYESFHNLLFQPYGKEILKKNIIFWKHFWFPVNM